MIIDFPETFAKVGPALVRTGTSTRRSRSSPTGSRLERSARGRRRRRTDGFRGTAPGVPDEDDATVAFDKLYKASEPTDVDRQTFDAQNFDAVILCYLAAVAAGSTDGTDMAARFRRRQRARRVTSTPGRSCPTRSRRCRTATTSTTRARPVPIDMDENGDATAGVYDIYQFKGGSARADRRESRWTPEGLTVGRRRRSSAARHRGGRGLQGSRPLRVA